MPMWLGRKNNTMQEKKTTKGEVEKSVSLEDIIKRVLDDKGIDVITYESNVRWN